MAETKLHNYSVQEKLNKMDVDLIDATLTTVAAAVADNEVVSQGIEIENAVAVNGGTAIIQSIVLNSDDAETPALDLVFSQVQDDISSGLSETVGDDEDIDSLGASVLGHISLSNYTNLVDCVTATKLNVGLIVKAVAGSKSIYVHAINRSGANFTPTAVDDLHLRLGLVKD
tara:strand:- start:32 stop:547 length:516 start_codon:yes stop_codon:yes gene_type:complete